MMSRGFIVSLRVLEMLCIVTFLPVLFPPVPAPAVMYLEMGKANFNRIAAKNISIQIKKFWYPADTVPASV